MKHAPLVLQILNTLGLYMFLYIVAWNTGNAVARMESVGYQIQQTETVLQRATDRQSDRISEVVGIIRSPVFCNPHFMSQTKTTISAGTNKIEVPGPGGIISAGSIFNVGTEPKKP